MRWSVSWSCSYQVLCSKKAAGRFASSARCWRGWPQRGSPWAWGSGLLWCTWLTSAVPPGHSKVHRCIGLESLSTRANNACEQKQKIIKNRCGRQEMGGTWCKLQEVTQQKSVCVIVWLWCFEGFVYMHQSHTIKQSKKINQGSGRAASHVLGGKITVFMNRVW